MLNRRAASVAIAAGCGGISSTQPAWPGKAVRVVVPFGPGGIADLTVRAVGDALSSRIGQAVVIENKPGAGGVSAGEAVSHAQADGHTLLVVSNGTAVKTKEGIAVQVVPFNGTPAVITALRGGQVDAAVEILGPVKAQVEPGALRMLSTMAKYDVSSWNGLAAPAKTPAAVVQKISAALGRGDRPRRHPETMTNGTAP